jgi:hypothetical protein
MVMLVVVGLEGAEAGRVETRPSRRRRGLWCQCRSSALEGGSLEVVGAGEG